MSGLKSSDLFLVLREEEDVKKAIGELVKWGCCPRCVLRFLGEKEQHIYRHSPEVIDTWVQTHLDQESEPQSTNGDSENKEQSHENKEQSNVCVACLGLLQDRYCSDKFVKEIKDKVVKEGHEFTDYFCSISTPVSMCLREASIWKALKVMFPKFYIGNITDDEVVPAKDVWKWINGQPLGNAIGVYFSLKSQYTVSLNFIHIDCHRECAFLFDLFPGVFKQRKNNKHGWEVFTRANVLKAIEDMTDDKFKKNYACPPRKVSHPCDCDPITCKYDAVFLAGRYNKYSRHMSQTPWLVDGGKKTESSIEEVICIPANQHIRAKEYRFSASGREDVDVKMLGTGRPFVVEFNDPHKVKFSESEMRSLETEINQVHADVKVRDLQLVTREDTSVLKEGETEKVKNYSAVCYAKRDLNDDDFTKIGEIQELTVNQKTPIRVLHRRPLATRPRVIHKASARPLQGSSTHFTIYLSTQAGTYIKEFVHGDFGRTSPNLGEILKTDCDILELSVEGVELDWPPKVDYGKDAS